MSNKRRLVEKIALRKHLCNGAHTIFPGETFFARLFAGPADSYYCVAHKVELDRLAAWDRDRLSRVRMFAAVGAK
jgi:hypothetical protein